MTIHEAKKKFIKKHWNDNCISAVIGIRIKNKASDIVLFVKEKDPSIPKDFNGYRVVQKIQKPKKLTEKEVNKLAKKTS